MARLKAVLKDHGIKQSVLSRMLESNYNLKIQSLMIYHYVSGRCFFTNEQKIAVKSILKQFGLTDKKIDSILELQGASNEIKH